MNRRMRRAAISMQRLTWDWEDRSHLASESPVQDSWGRCCAVVVNSVYSVQVYESRGGVLHAAIRRHDNGTSVPWADM